MPDLAIVDSRNVHGAAKDQIGAPKTPSISGIVNSLSRYGFDIVEVHVSVALARARDRQSLSREHATNTGYVNDIASDSRGHVLYGELHKKDRGVEEKIVDVQLALDIARHAIAIRMGTSPFDRIVVVSQDIDLSPALDYAAAQLAIPLAVVAYGVIDNRSHPYALLTPGVLAEMVGAPKMSGHYLRYLLAAALLNPQREEWKIVRSNVHSGDSFIRRTADGLFGYAPSNLFSTGAPGELAALYPSHLDFGRWGKGFPVLRCSAALNRNYIVQRAEVIGRRRLGMVTVQLPSRKSVDLRYPDGGVIPGDWVVLVTTQDGRRVAGPMGDPTLAGSPIDECSRRALPVHAVATDAIISQTRVEADTAFGKVVLELGRNPLPAPGMSCHAVVVASNQPGILPLALPLTQIS
jgi:hypothetical protein